MKITDAQFVVSNTDVSKCPAPNLPEYAFIGRSNVGKSSLINMLTQHNKLAKTSGKPGKTQLINHFIINDKWYLVDLPGYGYAKAAKTKRKEWGSFIEKYLTTRENLMLTFVLIDSRLEPQKIDINFINWCGENQIPFALVFTKSDKLKPNQLNKNVNTYKKNLLHYWEEIPTLFITSSIQSIGREEILEMIEQTNPIFHQTQ